MAVKQNHTQIPLVVKSEIKELLAVTAEKEGISLNLMCQILMIEALAARKKRQTWFANMS